MRETPETEPLEERATRQSKSFQCPECIAQFGTPEDLGAHLIRHEEVREYTPPGKRGRPTSNPCPKGCGRYFHTRQRRQGYELRAHLTTCAGAAPIVQGTIVHPKFQLIQGESKAAAVKA